VEGGGGVTTITSKIHFQRGRHYQRKLQKGEAKPPANTSKVPRISRLMAVAIRLDRLIREGAVPDQAELARLNHVTRARLTQIMNLLSLAPDIQEELLFLPMSARAREVISEREIRPIAATLCWLKQWQMWEHVRPTV
jgi:hypothetical protein